ncbi:hypothetical protein N7449_010145 [Penicillium cf. viridicatum]|uniref:Uncharacterized protein n=1 Tax=Penicillium cf. viridicatum TaxID=2972119 RepID=A0A9W9M2F9_9EURO|nr:hypothetical protein N7449_010145 [Penicillium cf. viridicatum]
MASTTASVYATGNGSLSAGSKRMREDDDIRPPESTAEYETSKRRKTITDATLGGPLGGPVGGPPILQPMKPSAVMARHRLRMQQPAWRVVVSSVSYHEHVETRLADPTVSKRNEAHLSLCVFCFQVEEILAVFENI